LYLGLTVKVNELFDGFGLQKVPPKKVNTVPIVTPIAAPIPTETIVSPIVAPIVEPVKVLPEPVLLKPVLPQRY
jgi:hypothetical protein